MRPILVSYAWGVLHAVLVQGASGFAPRPVADADFAGLWQIIDLPDLGPGYFEPEAGPPRLQIVTPGRERLRGNYRIGFAEGALTGCLRTFGAERVWVFEYKGVEIGSEHGCGWAQLLSPTALHGEFIDWVGHFVAKREALPQKRQGGARRQTK